MSKTKTGGYAFPNVNYEHGGPDTVASEGMTLRDYFAARAMQSILASSDLTASVVASSAYAIADAMVNVRNRTNETGPLMMIPIKGLDLTQRTINCLIAEDIYRVGDLIQRTENELLKTPNLGRKSLNEIKAALAEIGLTLNISD